MKLLNGVLCLSGAIILFTVILPSLHTARAISSTSSPPGQASLPPDPPQTVVFTDSPTVTAVSSTVSPARPIGGVQRNLNQPCNTLGAPPKHPYKQIMTLVGAVDTNLIREAMHDLAKVPGVTFFALDGTLLNLMRWGRIVN
eukprot:PhF_6_TR31139/c0_g1_i2/m.45602